MLKLYDLGLSCRIVLEGSIDDDYEQLQNIFYKNYREYNLEIINMVIPPSWLLVFLYDQIKILGKKVPITVHKNRVSRYLHNLGFNARYVSTLTKENIKNPNMNVLAIGGSADSGEKIIEILSNVDTTRYAVFIIQHIDPVKDGFFDEILTRYTKSNVYYAKNEMQVEIGNIYIASKDRHMLVKDNKIVLDEGKHLHSARPSISKSFESISDEYKDKLLAVLECGYGRDGVDSLPVLEKNNSCIIIQNPESCNADSIVLNAVRNKIYNYIFDTEDIISFVNTISISLSYAEWVTFLLEEIYNRYEYDFRSYQSTSIYRRVESFMIKHSITDIKLCVVLILYSKKIFESLFLEFSINVTDFFRKSESSKVMINLLLQQKNSYNIKIWSAGCSSGKEVYSTAIILSQLNMLHKSLIYATDFNPVVIDEAKNGLYSMDVFKKAKSNYEKLSIDTPIESYFYINNSFVQIKEEIKDGVLFFVHNLEKDSVFNEFDIIECKNVLIYFDEKLQEKVLDLFYHSLKFAGYLFLGPSESLPRSFEDRFERYDERSKVYKKVA